MDKRVLAAVYHLGQRNKIFGGAMRIVHKASSAAFFLIYSAGALYLALRDLPALIPYLAVPFCALAASLLLRRIIRRRRPPMSTSSSHSFPSNHSTSAAIIAFAVMTIRPGLGAAAMVLALITGASRLAVGVHYPSDVLAGFILSVAAAFIGFWLL